jgi:hypothetical protein
MKTCAMPLPAIAADDANASGAKDDFVAITQSQAILPAFGRKSVACDQTESKGGRAVYKASAKSCVGEESAKPRKEAFTLVVDAAGLQIFWADGTKSAVFARCAP